MTFATVKEVSDFIDKGFGEQTHVVTSVDNKTEDGQLNDGEQIISVAPWLGFIPEDQPTGEVTNEDIFGCIPYSPLDLDMVPIEDAQYKDIKSYLADSLEMKIQYDET
ncbi:hypothetical protein SARC_17639, partial [Sphaeroforma arctica JP610]